MAAAAGVVGFGNLRRLVSPLSQVSRMVGQGTSGSRSSAVSSTLSWLAGGAASILAISLAPDLSHSSKPFLRFQVFFSILISLESSHP